MTAARHARHEKTPDGAKRSRAPVMERARPPAAAAHPHEVRLIGGHWKRSRLPVADRPGLRPTPDRVRETLFNWLGQDLSGWHCLDAFAGSGALGFEAASRGAARVLMIERDSQLMKSLQQVRARLGATQVEIVCEDAMRVLARAPSARFDLVLLDPRSLRVRPITSAQSSCGSPTFWLLASASCCAVLSWSCVPGATTSVSSVQPASQRSSTTGTQPAAAA